MIIVNRNLDILGKLTVPVDTDQPVLAARRLAFTTDSRGPFAPRQIYEIALKKREIEHLATGRRFTVLVAGFEAEGIISDDTFEKPQWFTPKINASDLFPSEIRQAIATDARRVSVGPILPSLVDVRRKNDKRPADIRIAVDDSVAKELKPGADPNKRTVWMLVGVPRDFAAELELAKQEQEAAKERRIITPMEAARGPR